MQVGCSNTVSNRMKSLLASWSSEFGNESSFSGVCQLKTSLQTQGISFPAVRSTAMPSVRSSSHQQEDSDLKRAIELSLQDQSSRSQPATSSSVYPSLTTSHPIKHPSKSSVSDSFFLFIPLLDCLIAILLRGRSAVLCLTSQPLKTTSFPSKQEKSLKSWMTGISIGGKGNPL